MLGNVSAKINITWLDQTTVKNLDMPETSECTIHSHTYFEIVICVARWTKLERFRWVFGRTEQILYVLQVVLQDFNYSVKS